MPFDIIENEDGIITTITDNDKCPCCGRTLNAATATDGRAIPQGGDISVCAHCAALLEYNEDLTLKLLTYEEQKTLPLEVLEKILTAQLMVRSRRKDYH